MQVKGSVPADLAVSVEPRSRAEASIATIGRPRSPVLKPSGTPHADRDFRGRKEASWRDREAPAAIRLSSSPVADCVPTPSRALDTGRPGRERRRSDQNHGSVDWGESREAKRSRRERSWDDDDLRATRDRREHDSAAPNRERESERHIGEGHSQPGSSWRDHEPRGSKASHSSSSPTAGPSHSQPRDAGKLGSERRRADWAEGSTDRDARKEAQRSTRQQGRDGSRANEEHWEREPGAPRREREDKRPDTDRDVYRESSWRDHEPPPEIGPRSSRSPTGTEGIGAGRPADAGQHGGERGSSRKRPWGEVMPPSLRTNHGRPGLDLRRSDSGSRELPRAAAGSMEHDSLQPPSPASPVHEPQPGLQLLLPADPRLAAMKVAANGAPAASAGTAATVPQSSYLAPADPRLRPDAVGVAQPPPAAAKPPLPRPRAPSRREAPHDSGPRTVLADNMDDPNQIRKRAPLARVLPSGSTPAAGTSQPGIPLLPRSCSGCNYALLRK